MTTPDEAALTAAIDRLKAAVDALRAQVGAGEPALLSAPQAAAYLGYSPAKFYYLDAAGLLPCAVGFATDKTADKRWRRTDLARCVANLKRHRVRGKRT